MLSSCFRKNKNQYPCRYSVNLDKSVSIFYLLFTGFSPWIYTDPQTFKTLKTIQFSTAFLRMRATLANWQNNGQFDAKIQNTEQYTVYRTSFKFAVKTGKHGNRWKNGKSPRM